MMNLEPYKKEIFRRSAQRIQKRRRLQKAVLAVCIPLVLVLTAALLLPLADSGQVTRDRALEQADPSTGNRLAAATVWAGGKTLEITDTATVYRLYSMLADSDGNDPVSFDVPPGKVGAVPDEDASFEHETVAENQPENPTDAADGASGETQAISGDIAAGSMDRYSVSESPYVIVFQKSSGAQVVYTLTKEQYDAIMEVLK